jgi:hypothetical protein
MSLKTGDTSVVIPPVEAWEGTAFSSGFPSGIALEKSLGKVVPALALTGCILHSYLLLCSTSIS